MRYSVSFRRDLVLTRRRTERTLRVSSAFEARASRGAAACALAWTTPSALARRAPWCARVRHARIRRGASRCVISRRIRRHPSSADDCPPSAPDPDPSLRPRLRLSCAYMCRTPPARPPAAPRRQRQRGARVPGEGRRAEGEAHRRQKKENKRTHKYKCAARRNEKVKVRSALVHAPP